jgi:hypothetical protein
MITGNFFARITNNQHEELSKRKPNSLINVGIDENGDVYVYSPQAQGKGLAEVKCRMSFEEAKFHLRLERKIKNNIAEPIPIALDVKNAVINAWIKEQEDAHKTEFYLNK